MSTFFQFWPKHRVLSQKILWYCKRCHSAHMSWNKHCRTLGQGWQLYKPKNKRQNCQCYKTRYPWYNQHQKIQWNIPIWQRLHSLAWRNNKKLVKSHNRRQSNYFTILWSNRFGCHNGSRQKVERIWTTCKSEINFRLVVHRI